MTFHSFDAKNSDCHCVHIVRYVYVVEHFLIQSRMKMLNGMCAKQEIKYDERIKLKMMKFASTF